MAESRIPNLKRLRNERLLTQAQLAAALSIAPRTILRWENGDGEPGASELQVMARFFGVGIDQLISDLTPAIGPALKNVSEMNSAELDCMVARLHGIAAEVVDGRAVVYEPGTGQRAAPAYSSDWSVGGPLIERMSMHLSPVAAGATFAGIKRDKGGWLARSDGVAQFEFGATVLVAAVRALLVAKIGPALIG